MNPSAKLAIAAAAVLVIAAVGCNLPAAGLATGTAASMSPSPSPSPEPSQRAPEPPLEVTGRWVCGPPLRGYRAETVDVGDEGMALTRDRDGAWRPTLSVSDPRLEGTVYHTYEGDSYRAAGDDTGPEIFAATHRIENDGGAWESREVGASYLDGSPVGGSSIGEPVTVLIGEGGYEGLVAIMEFTDDLDDCEAEVRGIIFAGGPVPEPYIPE